MGLYSLGFFALIRDVYPNSALRFNNLASVHYRVTLPKACKYHFFLSVYPPAVPDLSVCDLGGGRVMFLAGHKRVLQQGWGPCPWLGRDALQRSVR